MRRTFEWSRAAQAWSCSHPAWFMMLSFAAAAALYAVTENGTLGSAAVQSLMLSLLGVFLVAVSRPSSLGPTEPAAKTAVLAVGSYLCVIALAEAVVGWQPQDLAQLRAPDLTARAFLAVVFCLATGIFEEALFRIVAFRALARGCLQNRALKNYPLMSAAIVSSVLFALLHVQLDVSSLFGDGELGKATLKVLQAALFGFVMAGIQAKGGSLGVLAGTHALYDLIVLGPGLLAGDAMLTAQSAAAEPLLALAVSSVMLVLAAGVSGVFLRSSDRVLRDALAAGDTHAVTCIL